MLSEKYRDNIDTFGIYNACYSTLSVFKGEEMLLSKPWTFFLNGTSIPKRDLQYGSISQIIVVYIPIKLQLIVKHDLVLLANEGEKTVEIITQLEKGTKNAQTTANNPAPQHSTQFCTICASSKLGLR